jgi:hypothetical protein
MSLTNLPNSRVELVRRRATGRLTWSGPALMLFARSIFSFLAQGLVAGLYALQSSTEAWRDLARWLPVYATLIDAGCLFALLGAHAKGRNQFEPTDQLITPGSQARRLAAI